MSNFLIKINPLHKAIFVIICAIVLSFTYSLWLNTAVFCFSAILLTIGSKKILAALRFLLPVSFCAAGFLLTGFFFGGTQNKNEFISVSSIETGLHLASRIFAFAGLGMLFSLTTDPIEFMHSLRRAGLPRKFACGFLCAFNLFPQIKKEYENARLAVNIRGIKLHPFSLKPIFSTLANCIRWSESLTIAMHSKGFEE